MTMKIRGIIYKDAFDIIVLLSDYLHLIKLATLPNAKIIRKTTLLSSFPCEINKDINFKNRWLF